MTFENLTLEFDAGIATLTVNRPQALNALNGATLREIDAAGTLIAARPDVGGVIVTGGGDRAFVAGADIAEMRSLSPDEAQAFSRLGTLAFRRLEQLPQVVIAAVNGFALGGGCELAMACDLIYATERSKFGQPEVNLGLIPGFGGTQRLMRRLGYGRAMELLVTGAMLPANEALALGLIQRIVPADALMETARATLRTVLAKGPLAVAATKRLAQAALETPLDHGLALESEAFGAIFATADAREGIAAFLEKRGATFTRQ